MDLTVIQNNFVATLAEANGLGIAENAGAAFQAASIVVKLRDVLTDDVMNAVFMPLMNTKVGFLTDKPGYDKKTGEVKTLYPVSVVRDAIVDAAFLGLLPTGNQFNIIAGGMYPTKEGFTHLLKKLGVKYFITKIPLPDNTPTCANICCKVNYEYQGDKNSFSINVPVKKDNYSSLDQIMGKAERKAKKALYEYLTGCDLGDADEDSSIPDDQTPVGDQKKEALRQRHILEHDAPKLL